MTLRNVTGRDREYDAMPRLLEDLRAEVIEPDGQRIRPSDGPHRASEFRTASPLAAGRQVSFPVELGHLGYWHFTQAGKHTLRLTYRSRSGRVRSNEVTFTVLDPGKDDLLARHPLPVVGWPAKDPAEEHPKVFLDQVKVGDKTYLLYRRYLSTRFGGRCQFTALVAELPGKVDLVAAGGYGAGTFFRGTTILVVYPSGTDTLTTLGVDSMSGEVTERLTLAPETGEDVAKAWTLFAGVKFGRREDAPPTGLVTTYAAFVAAVRTGDVAKFCLPHAVEVSGKPDPARGDYGSGMNLPWMKQLFREKVVSCRRDGDDGFLIRTSSSYLHWVQTRSGEWRIYRYGDKPVE
ncbi:MAG: hypothetical protein C0501_12370 [Isosphaera sp.]|nr:hypothetical protein [Isosphaera sp.]